MKLNPRTAFYFIATFSLGCLLWYFTLSRTSPHLGTDDLADDTANVAALRHMHSSHRGSRRDSRVLERNVKDHANGKTVVGQSNVMNGRNYLLALYYFEQMNNALKNLLHLGPVAMNLDLKIVEPFVVHSRLYGLPGMLPSREVNGTFYSLSTLFNIESIKQSMYSYANASLVSFEDFVLNAPRDVVVVYFIHKERPRPRSFCLSYRQLQIIKLVSEAESPIVDCTSKVIHDEVIYNGLLDTLANITAKHGVVNFRIVKFFCVAGERDVTTDQLKEQLGPAQKTVIVPEWRACAYRHCNIEMRHKYMTHSRPKLLYRLNREKEVLFQLSYVSSNTVVETASFLIENLNLTKQPYIAIYARIEKLLKKNGTLHINKTYINCCTSILQEVLVNVKNKYSLSNVLLITDLSKYGTDSCNGGCKMVGAYVLNRIEETNKIKAFNYDPSKTPLKIDNSGFAALVEMEMLARARRLITVGSGLFKEQLTQLYEKKNDGSDVFSICKERDLSVLHGIISSPLHCYS